MFYTQSDLGLLSTYIGYSSTEEERAYLQTVIDDVSTYLELKESRQPPEVTLQVKASLLTESKVLLPSSADFFSAELLAQSCIGELKRLFNYERDKPVEVQGIKWNGGFDSALKLDGVVRLAERVGSQKVTLYDLNNNAHEMNLADAYQVAIEVANGFQKKLSTKQAVYNTIEKSDAASLADLSVSELFYQHLNNL